MSFPAMPHSLGTTSMGVRATFEHLLIHLSPALSKVKCSKAHGDDDSDSFSCRGSGEWNCSRTLNVSIHTHANSHAVVELNRSAPMIHNLSLPLPTTTTSLLDVSTEAFRVQYDINHVCHYLASVESNLLQQAQSVTVRSAFPMSSSPTPPLPPASHCTYAHMCPYPTF